MNFPKPMLVFIGGFIVIAVVCGVLTVLGMHSAGAFSPLLCGVWMLTFVFYLLLWDMRKRWPHIPLRWRAGMLFPDAAAHRKHDEIARLERKMHD